MTEIRRADAAARKKAFAAIGGVSLVLLLLLYALGHYEPAVQAWLATHLENWVAEPGVAAVVALVLVLPVVLASAYLFAYGLKIIKTAELPPPNHTVLRDTVVRTGKPAVIRGVIVAVLSIVLTLAACAIPAVVWLTLKSLAQAG